MTQSNTYQQLQEAQQKLQQAQEAERQRIARETAAQKEIDSAQAEIAKLQKQARDEQFEQAIGRVREAVHKTFAAHKAMIDALEVGDVYGAIRLNAEAGRAWEALEQLRRQALGLVQPAIDEAVHAALSAPPVNQTEDYARYNAYRSTITRYENRLPTAYGSHYALIAWIAQAPDAETRRIRQGLTYAVIGAPVWNPGEGFDPMAAYTADQRRREGGFIHG